MQSSPIEVPASRPGVGPSLVQLLAPTPEGAEGITSREALAFVGRLARAFRPRIEERLAARVERQAAIDAGAPLDFLASTRDVREGDWKVAPAPRDLTNRKVEITGPVDRKMIVNALNSGANAFMADFEDATSPTWENLVRGQQNLFDAIRRRIDFDDAQSGKRYALGEKLATLLVRPRGLHLPEKHVLLDGRPIPGCLVDFGLYFFHNARALAQAGTGPYFYLPKLESHLEARLWNDVLTFAERALDLPTGTAKATVLIETLPAAFEMDEILYELGAHAAGLNCGRWDYIFSFIKTLRADPTRILPDRGEVGMTQPMMRAYTQLLIKTCHRRGAHAMGGMAAQIPIKNDPAKNEAALAKVRTDKLREVGDGHDGTWVAHPGLVPIAKEIFDAQVTGPNQLQVLRSDFTTSASELLRAPTGPRTEAGLRHSVRVGVQYLEAWLRGQGCVPLYDLMEDAATAEISRTQVWQWLKHHADVDGTTLTTPRFRSVLTDELNHLRTELGDARMESGRFPEARDLFDQLATSPELAPFLTLAAYDLL